LVPSHCAGMAMKKGKKRELDRGGERRGACPLPPQRPKSKDRREREEKKGEGGSRKRVRGGGGREGRGERREKIAMGSNLLSPRTRGGEKGKGKSARKERGEEGCSDPCPPFSEKKRRVPKGKEGSERNRPLYFS